jgi:23S rRNA (cytidine1920-2'-O)/16S rRNA (cytidine1409-2'-O)-methyltransferase
LPALTGCAAPDADIVPMVKPQFEVGRGQVGAGGVVHSSELRASAVLTVARRAGELGWHTVGVTPSPLPGPSGNVEYFLWLRAETDRGLSADELECAVRDAIEAGPK